MRKFPTFAGCWVVPKVRRSRGLLAAGSLIALTILAPAVPVAAASQSGAYTIKAGETLSEIAQENRVSTVALAAANGISDHDKIFAGRQLVLPIAGTAVSRPRQATKPSVAASSSATRSSVAASSSATRSSAAKPLARSAFSPGEALPPELRLRTERLALRPQFQQAAASYGVPLDLLSAVTWQESGWQNTVRSESGAVGIGQVMPDTVAFVNDVLLRKRLDPKVPEDNIRISAAFLGYLLKQHNGDQSLAIASYYQGLASVRKIGLYDDTKLYVQNVQTIQRVWF